MTQSIEKSFLVDSLTTTNPIYRDSLNIQWKTKKLFGFWWNCLESECLTCLEGFGWFSFISFFLYFLILFNFERNEKYASYLPKISSNLSLNMCISIMLVRKKIMYDDYRLAIFGLFKIMQFFASSQWKTRTMF